VRLANRVFLDPKAQKAPPDPKAQKAPPDPQVLRAQMALTVLMAPMVLPEKQAQRVFRDLLVPQEIPASTFTGCTIRWLRMLTATLFSTKVPVMWLLPPRQATRRAILPTGAL